MPDWALGGHLAMSLSVLMSAERKRFRLGYLADTCITHRSDDVRPQLRTLFADGEDPVRCLGPTLRLNVYQQDPYR